MRRSRIDSFIMEQEGLQTLNRKDIEALWHGETCDCELPRGKCGYRLLIAEKE